MVIQIILCEVCWWQNGGAELWESQLLCRLAAFCYTITHSHTHTHTHAHTCAHTYGHTHTQFRLLVQGYPTTQFEEVKWHLVWVVPWHHHSEAGRAAADRQTQRNLSHPCQREQIRLLPVFQVREVSSIKRQYHSRAGWIASFPGSFMMRMAGVHLWTKNCSPCFISHPCSQALPNFHCSPWKQSFMVRNRSANTKTTPYLTLYPGS